MLVEAGPSDRQLDRAGVVAVSSSNSSCNHGVVRCSSGGEPCTYSSAIISFNQMISGP